MITSPSARLAVVPPDSREVTLVRDSPRPSSSPLRRPARSRSWSTPSTRGFWIPPHRHTHEDEISYVISGEIGFRSDGREVSLGAGGYIVKPRAS